MQRTIEVGGRTVVLVGTSHVSPASVEEVTELIREHEPDTVCVELDESRLEALTQDDVWKDRDIAETIRRGDGQFLFFNLLLSIYQRRLGQEMDLRPGSEMLAAYETATDQGLPTELIDRDINVTLKRAFGRMSWWERIRILNALFIGFFEDGEEIDLEELTDEDVLHDVVTEFAGSFPQLKTVLIDERDAYMAEKIRQAEGDTVLAVIGAGHLDGIAERLQGGTGPDEEDAAGGTDLAALSEVPDTRSWLTVAKYAIPVLVVGGIVLGYLQGGFGVAGRLFGYWVGLNAGAAGLGAILVRAHPVTVIGTAIYAPWGSINPLVPTGLISSYLENRFRPPTVEDMESIGQITTYRGLWENGATRLLVVFMVVNVCSALATFTGAGIIVRVVSAL